LKTAFGIAPMVLIYTAVNITDLSFQIIVQDAFNNKQEFKFKLVLIGN
jgi:hypothetical protein